MHEVMHFSSETVAQMSDHAQQVFPEECCGVVLEKDDRQMVKPCRNMQDEKREEDPNGFEETARTAYYIHPDDLLDVIRMVDKEGYNLVAIYHSHPNTKAYFSATDRARAVWKWEDQEEPLYPGVSHIVVSVFSEGVKDMKVFSWEEVRKDFIEVSYVTN